MLSKRASFLFSALFLHAAYAEPFPMEGRISLDGFATNVYGAGLDGMQPVYGNGDGFLYADFMGDTASDDTFLLAPGAGARQILNNQILGTYFFSDYQKQSYGKDFWVLSPGVEWMSPHWDGHFNAYFPLNSAQSTASANYPDTFGIDDPADFSTGTNNEYHELIQPYDIMSNGLDLELGYSFAGVNNFRSRIYVGGYHYYPNQEAETVNGITGGFEQPVSRNISIAFMNSYDNLNNYKIGVGVKVTFGGESNIYSNDVHTRLLDSVERHVGIIATGAGSYDQSVYKDVGYGLEYDNVFFMSPDGTGNGTYGSPMPLTQTSLDSINAESPDGARIYLQGGSDANYYQTSDNVGFNGSTSSFFLYADQSIYGRSKDYRTSADEDEKPTVISTEGNYNTFTVNTENESSTTTFKDFNITSSLSKGSGTGIIVFADGDSNNTIDSTVNIENVDIDNMFTGYLVMMNAYNGDLTLNVNDSTFNDNTAAGMLVYNQGTMSNVTLNIANSTFNNNAVVETSDPPDIETNVVGGLAVFNYANEVNVNIYNSQFNGNVIADGENVTQNLGGPVAGFYALNVNELTINNSQFNENGVAKNGTVSASSSGTPVIAGAYIENQGVQSTLSINNSQFNGNGASSPSGAVLGSTAGLFLSGGDTRATIFNSTFNANGVNGSTIDGISTGLFVYNNGFDTMNISITNSTFSNNGANNTNGAYGIYGLASHSGTTFINYTDNIFSGTTQVDTNEFLSSGANVTWTP